MKYPNCRICKTLKERIPDLDDDLLDSYHESKIGWEDFPKRQQDEIIEIMLEIGGSEEV